MRLFANVGMGVMLLGFATFTTLDIATPVWAVMVTLTMASAGYPPSLAAADPAADPGILTAFTHVVDIAIPPSESDVPFRDDTQGR